MRITPISSYNSIFNSNVSFYGKSSGYTEKRCNYQQKSPFQNPGNKFSASFESDFDDIEKIREEVRRKSQEMQEQIKRIRIETQKQQEESIRQYRKLQEEARAELRTRLQREQEKIRQEQEKFRQEQERQQEQWRQYAKRHAQNQRQYQHNQDRTKEAPPKRLNPEQGKKYDCSEECQKDLDQLFKPLESLKVGEKVAPEINTTMKKRYKLLIKKYHPDLHSGNDKDFKEIQNQCRKRGLVDNKGRWIG